jgi:chromosome segregation ATPase
VDTAVALKLHDDLLASQPEGARHDSDICPFCVEKASQNGSTASDPSGSGRPDVSNQSTSTEGGTKTPMSDISQEAHEALLKKAVADAVAEATQTTEAALATKTKEAADAASRVQELETEVAGLKTETDRINKELDAAQVKLTSATEEAASLKKAAEEAAEQAKIAEVASKRGEQVKNLKLFPDDYVGEKASKWASLSDEAWDEQLEEWKRLKPASEGTPTTDAASAMTGTSENLTKEQQDAAAAGGSDKPKARRSVLGLV